ncbi:unnamed protein product [Dicrocoelium dendriticum]|nr:unnamed protein product [Dicrocoelium dendriticum]
MHLTASNDPVTRALTLRLFGTLSQVCKEHIGVHHIILKQIESHYNVESDAAIWSSHQLAPISSAFATSLCPIVCKRLGDSNTDLEIKLKLLRLGRHMHHEVHIIEQTRRCLVRMLSLYNTSESVVNILDTLTALDSSAPVYSSEQLDLLIEYVRVDQRSFVRRKALDNLCLLARRVPHHWEAKHILKLCTTFESVSCFTIERELILHAFFCLAESEQAVETIWASSNEYDLNVARCVTSTLLAHPATRVTIKAMQLGCKLVLSSLSRGPSESSWCGQILSPGQLVCCLVAQFTTQPHQPNSHDLISQSAQPWFLSSEDITLADLKHTYSLIVQFFVTFTDYTHLIEKLNLSQHIRLGGGPRVSLLCQFLSTLKAHLPAITSTELMGKGYGRSTLFASHKHGLANLEEDGHSILPVCGLLFQLTEGTFLTLEEEKSLLLSVAVSSARRKGPDDITSPTTISPMCMLPTWLAYQLARQASRYGQHALAAKLYDRLIPNTLSERTNWWIRGLAEFSRAEAQLVTSARCLQSDPTRVCLTEPNSGASQNNFQAHTWIDELISELHRAIDTISKARTMFYCIGGPSVRWFQAEYAGIRSDFLLCLAELCTTSMFFTQTACWPSFLAFNTQESNSESPELAPVPTWVMHQLDMWHELEDRISALQIECLDADQSTHEHLNAFSRLVKFFFCVLQSFKSTYESANARQNDTPLPRHLGSSSGDPFHDVIPQLHALAEPHINFDPTSPPNFNWLSGILLNVCQLPSHWPRFFFQRLQSTTVRLVLLPKAGSNPDDVLTISVDVGHMVQVMGVVQQRSRLPNNRLCRRIHAVEVELTVTEAGPDYGRLGRQNRRNVKQTVFSLRRSASLQSDYFHCEFCIQFPGHSQSKVDPSPQPQRILDKIYRISASPVLVDSLGNRWQISQSSGAPRESTLVRVEAMNSVASSGTSFSAPHTDRSESRTSINIS